MKKILGLDLGSSSIGWAFVQEDNENVEILGAGVRVVPITPDEANDFQKGNAISINKNRTLARGARRGLQRFNLRRNYLLKLFKELSFISNDFKYAEEGKFSTHLSYQIRAKAAEERISKEEFVQVLLMLNKKRGYKSSRKSQDSSSDGIDNLGTSVDGLEVAKILFENNLTPAQYLLPLVQQNMKSVPDFYSSDLQEELNKILFFQVANNSNLPKDIFENVTNKTRNATYYYFTKILGFNIAENKGNREEKKIQALKWRVEGLSKVLSNDELGYVIGDLNDQLQKASGYLGAISNRSKELLFHKQTVGQYLYQKLLANPLSSQKNMVFMRSDYQHEFDQIWDVQKKYYPELTDELKKEVRDVTIFYQRKLKSQKHLISICEFEKNHRVVPKSSPIFQEFRMWQNIRNLEVKNNSFELDEDAINGIYEILSFNSTLKNTELLKLIGANPKTDELNFDKIEGNRTKYEFIRILKNYWEEYFDGPKISDPVDSKSVQRILCDLELPLDLLDFDPSIAADQFDKQKFYQLWHLFYTAEDDKIIISKLKEKFNINSDLAKALLGVRLETNYGSISSKAIRKILPHIQEGAKYDVACVCAKYKSHSKNSLTREEIDARVLKDNIPLLKKNSLRNPVVEKILNQTINVVNAIMESEKFGKPDEIRIELARELKANNEQRSNMTKSIVTVTKEHEEIRKKLNQEFKLLRVTKNDIIRYKLWMETNCISLYTGKPIPASDLFSNQYDIDHIIPQSRLFDDSFSNKTLCERALNIEKSNQTAFSFLKGKLNAEEFAQYLARIAELGKAGKIKRTKLDKLSLANENIPEDFINRQLNETQYIAVKAKELLSEICRNVYSTNGAITDRLRNDWGLTDIMKELNFEKYQLAGLTYEEKGKNGERLLKIRDWTKRNDHRHHAMDAITIALTKQAYIQYLNSLSAKTENVAVLKSLENAHLEKVDGKWKFKLPKPNLRQEFKAVLENILVSQKAKNKVVTKNINKIKRKGGDLSVTQLTPRGQLHKETVYGKKNQYETSFVKINASFNKELINRVANQKERQALLKRLEEFKNDPKLAFTGKNSLDKNPIYLDDFKKYVVPDKVKLVDLVDIYTKRANVDVNLDDKKIDKIIDPGVKRILKDRLAIFSNDPKKAFVNLDENPIFLDKAKKIIIKKVTMSGVNNVQSLHHKKDLHGNEILDENLKRIPVDFVSTGNNHHVAIFQDSKGNLQEEIVSFYEAAARASAGEPVVNRVHKEGWKFLFTMKQNEYFIFPSDDFDPNEIDLFEHTNKSLISKNMYRVQKFTTKDYFFRHHLETNVDDIKELRGISYKRTGLTGIKGIIKIRLNHLGEIVKVGEY
jgi:CRISPR-associated endonuclease Csn1